MFCKSQQICTTLDLSYVFEIYIVKHKWGGGCTENFLQLLVANSDELGSDQPWWAEANLFRQLQQVLPPQSSTQTLT